MMWMSDSTIVLTMVAKGFGAAAVYCSVVVALMYPVARAAGFLG
jgi:hypothetical protein